MQTRIKIALKTAEMHAVLYKRHITIDIHGKKVVYAAALLLLDLFRKKIRIWLLVNKLFDLARFD